eukprot:TRINITY_DN46150_c0_g1_i1.p2 TRINITY_DN46150_c0_g1~~TRINITY_DN46150_c0_g1_i1.p2  ORF type:complete len:454 (-),score=256.28 TRINITY_DN46150_c0_g1_i1:125-1486(-)
MVGGRRLAVALAVVAMLATAQAIPLYVMLPLTAMNNDGTLNNPSQLLQQLRTLKQQTNFDGVMSDVWWGIVEAQGPGKYNWDGYKKLISLVREVGDVKFQAVMSFHQCGGNVGDNCFIPLPAWARSCGRDCFYTDREGNVDYEYLSLGVDDLPYVDGRSAVQIYTDFMASFRDNVLKGNEDIIDQLQIGMGPAGELRYPGYKGDTYPGIGEFQCYDKFMLANLAQAANDAGHPEWGHGGPSNAGTYKQQPSQTAFWSDGGFDNYKSEYGNFFLSWYSRQLIDHGARVLNATRQVFADHIEQRKRNGADNGSWRFIAAKVSGIHWQYKDPSHAAECTSGYYNTNNENAYLGLARLFAALDTEFDFTAYGLFDKYQCSSCAPQELVQQVGDACRQAGITLGGENALEQLDVQHLNNMISQASSPLRLASFAFLRLTDAMLNNGNFQNFARGIHAA